MHVRILKCSTLGRRTLMVNAVPVATKIIIAAVAASVAVVSSTITAWWDSWAPGRRLLNVRQVMVVVPFMTLETRAEYTPVHVHGGNGAVPPALLVGPRIDDIVVGDDVAESIVWHQCPEIGHDNSALVAGEIYLTRAIGCTHTGEAVGKPGGIPTDDPIAVETDKALSTRYATSDLMLFGRFWSRLSIGGRVLEDD